MSGAATLLAAVLAAAAIVLWPGGHRAAPGPAQDGHPEAQARRQRVRLWRRGHRRARTDAPVDSLRVADTLDLMAYALMGGHAVVDCLEVVAAQSEPDVAAVLRQVAAAQRWGVRPAAAWGAVGVEWAAAGRALALADRTGAAPAALLEAAAEQVREQRAHEIELAGARLGVRLVLPLGLCFLPAFVLLTVVPAVVATTGSVLADL